MSRVKTWKAALVGFGSAGALCAGSWSLAVLDGKPANPFRDDPGAPSVVIEDRWQQAAEDRLWYGNEMARRWHDVDDLPLDVRTDDEEARDRRREELIQSVLENVSPALRHVLERHSGRLVFHEGQVTDLADCHDLRGVDARLYEGREFTYDECVGLYRGERKMAFVQTDRPLERVRHTLLHELGHMLDHALQRPSQTDAFDRVLSHDDERGDLGYPEDIDFRDRKQREYFAESFAEYHMGGASRVRMRREWPAAARYWDDLVARQNDLRQYVIEAAVEGALRRRQALREADAERPRRRVRRRVTTASR